MRLPRDQVQRIEKLAAENGAKFGRPRGSVPSRRRDIPGVNVAPGTHVLVMEGWLPMLLNDMLHARRRDWMRRHKRIRGDIAFEAARQDVARASACRRVTLHVTFPEGRSLPDPDALTKSLGDALKHAGLLVDDDYFHVEWMPPVYYSGPCLRTEIVMEDIPVKTVTPGLSSA